MAKMTAAIIGCGRIASVYREAFLKLKEEVSVVLAVDKATEHAQNFAADFPGCEWSDQTDLSDLGQVLTRIKPDVVHILLPHHLHKEYANLAMECGCHVLTEKPIALTLEDADSMIQTAKSCGKKLGVIFQNRYITGIQAARKLLDSGKLGRVTGAFSNLNWYRPASYYDCDWKGYWATEGGGVVIDQAIHSIDLVRYLIQENAIEADGHYSCRVLHKSAPQVEVEDEADAAITFQNGAVYSFFATNYYTSNRPIQVEISCENGSIHLDYQTVTIEWANGQKEVIVQKDCPDSSGKNYWGSCHYLQIKDFYQCLKTETFVPWDPTDAKKTLEIVLAIYQSSRENRPIKL